jgi:integrase
MPRITKRLVESTEPQVSDVVLRDSETKGFLCKITPKCKRVYLLYYRTKEGRERRPVIGEHGSITCDQARKIAIDWLTIVRQGGDPSQDRQAARKNLTPSQFADKYLYEYGKLKKASSIKEDERLWRLHILPVLGKLPLSTVTRNDILRLHSSMSESPVAANRATALLSKAFNLAIEWGDLKSCVNPASRIRKYKEQSKERFLSSAELATLGDVLRQCEYERVESPSVIVAIRLLIFTGCRRNEVLQLQWKWIDFENGKIDFPDSKTGKKSVYLNPPAVELLKATEQIDGNPYVCFGRDGIKHLVNIQKAWSRIRHRAGLNDVRIHDLRHSFASVGAAGGLSLLMIGKLLGHKEQGTTEKYAHLIGDPMKEANAMIGNRIAAAMAGDNAEVLPLRKV